MVHQAGLVSLPAAWYASPGEQQRADERVDLHREQHEEHDETDRALELQNVHVPEPTGVGVGGGSRTDRAPQDTSCGGPVRRTSSGQLDAVAFLAGDFLALARLAGAFLAGALGGCLASRRGHGLAGGLLDRTRVDDRGGLLAEALDDGSRRAWRAPRRCRSRVSTFVDELLGVVLEGRDALLDQVTAGGGLLRELVDAGADHGGGLRADRLRLEVEALDGLLDALDALDGVLLHALDALLRVGDVRLDGLDGEVGGADAGVQRLGRCGS